MSEPLKPCSTCKTIPQIFPVPLHGWTIGCRCTGPIEFFATEAEAITKWNHRHP